MVLMKGRSLHEERRKRNLPQVNGTNDVGVPIYQIDNIKDETCTLFTVAIGENGSVELTR